MKENQLKSLIKKTQKKCEENLAKKQAKLPKNQEEVETPTEATDIFREMKKLPFSE